MESRLLEVSLTPTPVFVESEVDMVEATPMTAGARSALMEYRCWMRAHRDPPRASLAGMSMGRR
jgi:hypothetical protein